MPIRARGRTFGALSVYRRAENGRLAAGDLVVLQHLADRAALSIDNSRLLNMAEREIHERRRVEDALRTSETRLRTVSEAAPVVLFSIDRHGVFTVLEGGLMQNLHTIPGAVGDSVFEIFEDYPELLTQIRQAMSGEQRTRARLPFPGFELEAFSSPMYDDSGRPDGIAGIIVDISDRIAAEAIADQMSRKLAALVETSTDVVAIMTPDGMVHYVNPAIEKILGQRWQVGQTIDVFRLMHPSDRERVRDVVRRAMHTPGQAPTSLFRMIHADGTWRTVESTAMNLMDDPAIGGFVVTLHDVTDRQRAEEAAAVQASRQADVAKLGHWALVGLDLTILLDDAMDILARQLGADCVHVLDVMPGAPFLVLRASLGHEGATDGVALISTDPSASPASLAVTTGETVVSTDLATETRFDTPAFWSDAGCASVLEVPIAGQDEPIGILGIGHRSPRDYVAEDIDFATSVANVLAAATGRSRAEQMIREQSLRDLLTGLPNRLALLEHLDHLLGFDDRPTSGALFVLDIDRFKEINDTLGHQVGDRVLLEVADRFRRIGDQIDMVARLGGDEFAIYTSTTRTPAETDRIARHILEVLGEPAEIGGVRLRLRGSIGIVENGPAYAKDVTGAVSLLRRAEAAMYRAKRQAGGAARWTPDLDQTSVSRLSLAGELGEALESREFVLNYQPKVICRTNRPVGVEALIRWRHPVRGTVMPDAFVPLAEQTGIIRRLTVWVLDEALAQLADWKRQYADVSMAINLSASTLHDPELFDSVADAIARSGVDPTSVELEITESAVMHDPERALEAVTELNKTGVRFAIDDFGIGYSSLAYLQRLPVSSVKIDKSFVLPILE
ncbi:MAG TPA: EAL domain-containing protein, partial [Acidimicrobiales bacterium]|nr:EAL domain-containing protein [Acidimicrobiales bacterium]